LINRRMSENYLSDAASILKEAHAARGNGVYHRALRLSQESLELTLKAVLRAVGIEYPKEHEVSEAIQENLNKFPDWFASETAYLQEGSAWLWERRGPSMYGDEIAGKPAAELFTADDSRRAIEYADRALEIGKRLLSELFH
jgi:HEPN domain-containing protein